jgi:hypothetical protein
MSCLHCESIDLQIVPLLFNRIFVIEVCPKHDAISKCVASELPISFVTSNNSSILQADRLKWALFYLSNYDVKWPSL